jgi:CBS domain-containing protein
MADVQTGDIGSLISPTAETIGPDESVTVAKRRMDAATARSLIVVEGDRPIGIVEWRDISRLDGSTTVREAMTTDFPVLRPNMLIGEVREQLRTVDVDFDHLPVIDDSGALIGEVPRGLITKSETATTSATSEAIGGPEQDRSAPGIHLEQGMKVVGVDDDKIGTVDEIDVSAEGHIAHFTVKYGLLGRHSKRLPADVVKAVDGETVKLGIGEMEFKMLADTGEEIV